jgi:hypothetical protein
MALAKEHKLQRELDRENRDSAINRAMAEVAGRKLKYDTRWWVEIVEGVWGLTEDNLAYYVEDLNAVHEVENSLSDKQHCILYAKLMDQYPYPTEHRFISATARQRCEAILKTLNRWNPEWDYPI